MKGLNIQQMMKQAKKLQDQLAKQQEELAKKTFEASSGGGMVTATVNGKFEMLSVKIDPEVYEANKDIINKALVDLNKKIGENLFLAASFKVTKTVLNDLTREVKSKKEAFELIRDLKIKNYLK